ncbi:MAG: hypothetical protein DI536_32290 [Archangium gephyra]|uniref:Uncharacterized protein n=1 Tax=Archangium gephyra TaxID=48 RepID=A0A2W5T1M5_9BACT|nr:MAG: hypothetical protein DI536_32290 [Archangium gephyra]
MRHVCWAVLVLSAREVHLDDYGRRWATAMCEREVRCGAREPVDCTRQLTVPDIEEKILDTWVGAASSRRRLCGIACVATPVLLMIASSRSSLWPFAVLMPALLPK